MTRSLGLCSFVAAGLLALCGCTGVPYTAEGDFENEGRFTYTGPYVGAGYTSSMENFDSVVGTNVDDSAGLHARVGYRGSRYAAFEIVGAHSTKFEVTSTLEYDSTAVTANLKLFPLGFLDGNMARIQPYGAIGTGLLGISSHTPGSHERNDRGAVVRYAGGADLYLTDNVLLSAEAALLHPQAARIEDFEYTNLNFGVQVRF